LTESAAIDDGSLADCRALERMMIYVIEELERLRLLGAAADVRKGLMKVQALTA
jgi:hypothetical protein